MNSPISEAYPSAPNAAFGVSPGQTESQGGADGADLMAAIWRYRWAVLLPGFLGLVAGFLVYLKTPETYRSTSKLIFESDRPVVFDSMTGDVHGGVPSLEILYSQLVGDEVVRTAFQSEKLEAFMPLFENEENQYRRLLRESLIFESDLKSGGSASALVANLSFQHTNPDLCKASVRAFSDAMRRLFAEKHKSSRDELLHYIKVAIDQLHPKMTALEERYRDFRTSAPLVWNEKQEAVNPHRERQLYLTGRRSELFEQVRQKAMELAAIQQMANEAKDPIIGLSIIGQLVGKEFKLPESVSLSRDMREGDEQLAQLKLDEQLVPLMIERNKMAAEFGDLHPTVKQLDAELGMMKEELTRLVSQQTNRILEIMEENKVDGIDPAQKAAEAIEVILTASNAEASMMAQQLSEIDNQIESEKLAAVELAKFEHENSALLREIERNRELIDQLEEQMARVSLTDDEGGIRVSELTAASAAGLVGPSLVKSIGIGLFLGLAIGAGLALLMEKNANTFRDPDAIIATVGAPILTHVPNFKGKVRRSKKDSPNQFERLDPFLAVVHAPSSVPAEAIRSCRTSLFFDLAGVTGGKIIQVTSPLPGDGKSTIAGNLACSIAQSGKKTLVIDCDLRRPQITDNFSGAEKLGLIDVLSGNCEHVDAIHETPLATLSLMPSGPIPANPAEALTLPEMSELLELLREEYDYIILDTPPLLVVTDPSILAGMADGVIMALKIRRKSKPNTKEAAGILKSVGARLIGVVINNSDESTSSDGYKGYGYYRYGRHTSRYYRKSADNGSKSGKLRTPVIVSGRGGGAKAARLGSGTPSAESVVASAGSINGHSSGDEI